MNEQVQVVILAAGKGMRLGRSLPKPLTPLEDGRTILRQQIDNLRGTLDPEVPITAVVGFEACVVMEAAPDLLFAYNAHYDSTNTAKSLLLALTASGPGGVLWLNGDVVFDPCIIEHIGPWLRADQSFVCVNLASVGEEEIKYTLDRHGWLQFLSKTVVSGLGEAVGINYVSSTDRPVLVEQLRRCADTDYFERGIEKAIEVKGLRIAPVDITRFAAVEVDFEDDLRKANRIHRPIGVLGDSATSGV